jgi:hypothetical protein
MRGVLGIRHVREVVMGLVVALTAACSGDPAPSTTPVVADTGSGACGDVTLVDVTIRGQVHDGSGAPVDGVSVVLEERNWRPGELYGQDRSDASGRYEIAAGGLSVVEGCWGTAVQYWVVGEGGGLFGERPINAWLEPAITAGQGVVEIDAAIIVR